MNASSKLQRLTDLSVAILNFLRQSFGRDGNSPIRDFIKNVHCVFARTVILHDPDATRNPIVDQSSPFRQDRIGPGDLYFHAI
jgi:hypothetical protein